MYWFVEKHREDTGILMGAKKTWTYRSNFQDIAVLETDSWGRVLVLDGLIQFTDRDEFIYHEMLSHVPLRAHPEPKQVLIIGGGDGGTLREVLRHPVNSVVLCEIDPMVIEVVKTHWPDAGPVFQDPRVRIESRDGRDFLESTEDRYDVILVDSSEPVSHSRSLFDPTFLELAARRLRRPGFYATQSLSVFYRASFIRELLQRLRSLHPRAYVYTAPVPCYPAGWWSFIIAGNDETLDPRTCRAGTIPEVENTRYYSARVHSAAFVLPRFLAAEMEP